MGFPHSSVGKESTSNAGDPHLRGLKQILCTPRPRDPSEPETECLLWRYGQWTVTGAGSLGAADLGMA